MNRETHDAFEVPFGIGICGTLMRISYW